MPEGGNGTFKAWEVQLVLPSSTHLTSLPLSIEPLVAYRPRSFTQAKKPYCIDINIVNPGIFEALLCLREPLLPEPYRGGLGKVWHNNMLDVP